MYVYSLPPIDWMWEYLPTVSDLRERFRRDDCVLDEAGDLNEPRHRADFDRAFDQAKDLATIEGWEGDFRQGPRVFWVPGMLTFEYGFVWKQDNDGMTFVVSPQPLVWLDEWQR